MIKHNVGAFRGPLDATFSVKHGDHSHEYSKHSLSFVQWDFLQVTSDLLLLIVMFYCYIIKFAEYVDQKSKTRSDRDEKSGKHGKQACTIFSVT